MIRIIVGILISAAICIYFANYSDALPACAAVDAKVRHTLLFMPIVNVAVFAVVVIADCRNTNQAQQLDSYS